ncbi:hypothetical protein [Saccharopolyspora spinosa]|uniref:Uncharacterized protein n=1 Tax=Saccharopolyspora spinosa TaxID=60894 RepID=A0A2N3Y090_SACSN|nr:hypothetical protein [Saccharopolyspora spinosa]PKW16333.1 hypothetical protein A8926_4154 [Saccharopolyspora spinosa]
MSSDSIKRVQYYDDQILRLQDFTDEQDYHVAMRRRHNISGHAWGIASGLTVTQDNNTVSIQPGFAVDGYGRELVLTNPTVVAEVKPRTDSAFTYDLFLCYQETSSDPAPKAFDPDQRDTRWTEEPVPFVQQVTKPSEPPNPDQPPLVPECDWSFDATCLPPRAAKKWPVFLARITTNPTDPQLTIDPGQRRYVRVIAARVEHPAKTTAVNVGPDRFSVEIKKEGDQDTFESGKVPDLTVADDGVTVAQGLTVPGELAARTLRFAEPITGESDAQPWRMYLADNNGFRELRIELPAGKDKPALTVGAWSELEKKFLPCLTVGSDRTVTVDGTLVVRGGMDGVTGGSQDANLPLAIATLLDADQNILAALATSLLTNYPDTARALAGRLSSQG